MNCSLQRVSFLDRLQIQRNGFILILIITYEILRHLLPGPSLIIIICTMFNGVHHPAIVIARRDGRTDVIREFGYEDFRNRMS